MVGTIAPGGDFRAPLLTYRSIARFLMCVRERDRESAREYLNVVCGVWCGCVWKGKAGRHRAKATTNALFVVYLDPRTLVHACSGTLPTRASAPRSSARSCASPRDSSRHQDAEPHSTKPMLQTPGLHAPRPQCPPGPTPMTTSPNAPHTISARTHKARASSGD